MLDLGKWVRLEVIVLGLVVTSCTSSKAGKSTGTNWLACDSDSDCAAISGTHCGPEGVCIGADGGSGGDGGNDRADASALRFTGESFSSISGTSDDDIWVLGRAGEAVGAVDASTGVLECPVDRSARAIVRHYDGTVWTRTDGVADTALVDIWAGGPTDVWAVGLNGVVAHYDGTRWIQTDVRGVAAVDLSDPCYEVSLAAVWGSGENDVWAVGYAYPSTASPTLVLHYDGTDWTREPVTDLDGLFDVWGTSASDVWVVGSNGITHHFDGMTWTKVNGGTSLYRFGIWGAATNDIWAVGNAGSITHYDGMTWKTVRAPGWEQFEAVWGASADDVWTVGARTEQGMSPVPLTLHWNGREWSEATSNAAAGLVDVWVSNTGRAWSVSSDEIIELAP